MLILAIGLAGLMLRLAVPAGFMPVLDQGRPALAMCSGYGTIASQAAAPAGSATSPQEHHHQDEPKADGSCAFADMSVSMIGGADSVQLAGALLFILTAALFFAAVLPPRAALRLRPPLRGPPLPA